MSVFKLQQFEVQQSQSGMKICADSLLFGALIPLDQFITFDEQVALQVLDIGTGTGLLALMLAQRISGFRTKPHQFHICAMDISEESVKEAGINFSNSPWAHHLNTMHGDITQSLGNHSLLAKSQDLIICNPPFFHQHRKAEVHDRNGELRNLARHTDSLSFEQLCECVDYLLSDLGRFSVLIPTVSIALFEEAASANGLIFEQLTFIQNTRNSAKKVVVIDLVRRGGTRPAFMVETESVPEPIQESLIRFEKENLHTAPVQALLSDFLLRYG